MFLPDGPLSQCGRAGRIFVAAVLVLTPAVLRAQANLDFESGGAIGSVPRGWTFTPPAGLAFRGALNGDACLEGHYCAVLAGAPNPPATAFGDLFQTLPTMAYRGRSAAFRVAVRVEGAGTWAVLWLRVEKTDGTPVFVANSAGITSATWHYYSAVAPVAADSARLIFGVLNFGSGRVWVDDAGIQAVDPASAEGPRPLSDAGLANLVAFAKVLGYVRYFHPSDQAELTDWESFAAFGARTVEGADTLDDLAAVLQSLFDPIAPTVRIFSGATRPALPAELRPASGAGLQLIRWNRYGVGLLSTGSIYSNIRQASAAGSGLPAGFQDPAGPFQAGIGRGLSVLVPLTLYTDAAGTLPHRLAPVFHCCAYLMEDRGTRLASVILAWNVARHSYPYLDIVDTDWPSALAAALRSAATDSGPSDFLVTISRLWTALHDGHGFVWAPLVGDGAEKSVLNLGSGDAVRGGGGAGDFSAIVNGDDGLILEANPAPHSFTSAFSRPGGADNYAGRRDRNTSRFPNAANARPAGPVGGRYTTANASSGRWSGTEPKNQFLSSEAVTLSVAGRRRGFQSSRQRGRRPDFGGEPGAA